MGKTIIEGDRVIQEDNGVDDERRALRDERIRKRRINAANRRAADTAARGMLGSLAKLKPGDPVPGDVLAQAKEIEAQRNANEEPSA